MKSCFFIGHRDAPGSLADKLDEAAFLIAYVLFVSGGAFGVMEYAERRERRGLLRITRLRD